MGLVAAWLAGKSEALLGRDVGVTELREHLSHGLCPRHKLLVSHKLAHHLQPKRQPIRRTTRRQRNGRETGVRPGKIHGRVTCCGDAFGGRSWRDRAYPEIETNLSRPAFPL